MVITLIGSLFCLSISQSQCEYITSSEWYKIFGITETKTQRGWQAFYTQEGVFHTESQKG